MVQGDRCCRRKATVRESLRRPRRLWPFLAPYTSRLLLATACMFVVSLSHLLAPYLVKLSLDRYIAPADLAGLTLLVWIYAGNALVGWIMQYQQALIL